MSDILLTRRNGATLTDEQHDMLRGFLFDMIDGQSDEDRRAWRRFWNGVFNLPSGEFLSVRTKLMRNSAAHKRQMQLEAAIFAAQTRMKSREEFRLWLKVGSGWVTWASGPKGGVFPVPKSISFARCDEASFTTYCDGVRQFLESLHAHKYLWPGTPAQECIERMAGLFELVDQLTAELAGDLVGTLVEGPEVEMSFAAAAELEAQALAQALALASEAP